MARSFDNLQSDQNNSRNNAVAKGQQKQKKYSKQNVANMINDELEIRADIQDESWENEMNHPDYF